MEKGDKILEINPQMKRHIGRLTREQIQPLLDAVVLQREQRRECPDCRYISGNNWQHCAVYEALVKSGPALQIHRDLRAHEAGCPDCFVESQWKEFVSYCEQCQELSDLFYLYHRRLQQIRYKEQVHCFQVEKKRLPYNALELVLWLEKR